MQKRGLSEVVTAVLMILLVIAAVFIIWAVLRPKIEESVGGASLECINTELEITKVVYDPSEDKAEVYITRGNRGPDEIAGIIVLINGAQVYKSTMPSTTDNLTPLASVKVTTVALDGNDGPEISASTDIEKVEVAAILDTETCPASMFQGEPEQLATP